MSRLEAKAASAWPVVELREGLLLGRWQTFLAVPEWQTCAAAARVFQGVAKNLPVPDQHELLAQASFHCEDDDDDETNSSSQRPGPSSTEK